MEATRFDRFGDELQQMVEQAQERPNPQPVAGIRDICRRFINDCYLYLRPGKAKEVELSKELDSLLDLYNSIFQEAFIIKLDARTKKHIPQHFQEQFNRESETLYARLDTQYERILKINPAMQFPGRSWFMSQRQQALQTALQALPSNEEEMANTRERVDRLLQEWVPYEEEAMHRHLNEVQSLLTLIGDQPHKRGVETSAKKQLEIRRDLLVEKPSIDIVCQRVRDRWRSDSEKQELRRYGCVAVLGQANEEQRRLLSQQFEMIHEVIISLATSRNKEELENQKTLLKGLLQENHDLVCAITEREIPFEDKDVLVLLKDFGWLDFSLGGLPETIADDLKGWEDTLKGASAEQRPGYLAAYRSIYQIATAVLEAIVPDKNKRKELMRDITPPPWRA